MTGTRLLMLVLGFWVIMRSVNKDATHRTLIDRIAGNPAGGIDPHVSVAPGTVGGGVSAVGSALGAVVDPFPGATGSRLDQGFDLTTKQLLSPFEGTVVVANQSDAGWAGGGYLAIRSNTNPSKVIFMAEGLAPTVQVGQKVRAGQSVAIPRLNPYNSVFGNIESGWADPNSPGRPLAQVSSNKPSVALGFYNWLRGLGGPTATSTSHAGYA